MIKITPNDIPNVWVHRIRDELDYLFNGSPFCSGPRRIIIDVAKMTDEQVKELWREVGKSNGHLTAQMEFNFALTDLIASFAELIKMDAILTWCNRQLKRLFK